MDENGLARYFAALEPPEGVKAELLRGVIVMTPTPDVLHNVIVARVQTQDVGIVGEASEPVPDLVVLKRDLLPESGRLLSCRLITMVVEVVSERGVHQDYVMAQCVLLTKPTGEGEEADYLTQKIVKFGDRLPLEALGIELDTSEFGTFTGVKPHRYP